MDPVALQARIDQVAAQPDTQFELSFYGDFYISVDSETGDVRKEPRPYGDNYEHVE